MTLSQQDTAQHVLKQDSPEDERTDAIIELHQKFCPDNSMMKMAVSLVDYYREHQEHSGQKSQNYDRMAVINDRWIEKPRSLDL